MARLTYVGYHTCKTDGGYERVREVIPFLSGDGKNQWLTQGYYFWPDSPYWAKTWGQPNLRAIGKFNIDLCHESELLDLVGNVCHSEHFQELVGMVMAHLDPKDKNDITINRAIFLLRKLQSKKNTKGIFPYLAIKAKDKRYDGSMSFIKPKPGSKAPKMDLITRQQLCVFEEARPRIFLNGFIEPESFVDKYLKETSSE